MSVYPERRKGKLTGKWIAETTIIGERHRKRFETKREGEQWADTVKVLGHAPAALEAPTGPTLADVMAQMRSAKTGRDKTGRERAEHVADFIGRDMLIAAIDTSTLDKLVAFLKRRKGRKGTLASGTINRYLSAISAVLTYAKERGYIAAVPVVPWQREGGKRLHWLTEEAEDAVCSDMIQRGQMGSALTCRVLTATGMRWGEFASLEVGQIDITKQDAWVRLWETKTDDPRSVPIDRDMARSLRALIAANGVPSYYTFRKDLKTALQSAGQSPDICVHSLRHTTATRLVQRGVHIAVVQKFLGHRAIQTTMRYVKVADDDLTQAAKKLSPNAGQSSNESVSDTNKIKADVAEW